MSLDTFGRFFGPFCVFGYCFRCSVVFFVSLYTFGRLLCPFHVPGYCFKDPLALFASLRAVFLQFLDIFWLSSQFKVILTLHLLQILLPNTIQAPGSFTVHCSNLFDKMHFSPFLRHRNEEQKRNFSFQTKSIRVTLNHTTVFATLFELICFKIASRGF